MPDLVQVILRIAVRQADYTAMLNVKISVLSIVRRAVRKRLRQDNLSLEIPCLIACLEVEKAASRLFRMPRTFAYVRVSTAGQTTENQTQEIEAAGFKVDRRRVISETVSGSSAIEQRPGFMKLLDRLEQDDVLIVTKLDRLGRNAIDVGATVAKLADRGIRVHCLALGGVDLTSPAGRMTTGVINAVAQFERDLLIERTQAGLKRARAEGTALGRPATLEHEQRVAVRAALATGASVSALAREYRTSRQTIMRARGAAQICA
jgi:putative DNA-invertase from lambdoid prophage Rac